MAEKWIVYKIFTPLRGLMAINYCHEDAWQSVKKANMVRTEKVSEHDTEKEACRAALMTVPLPTAQ
jgi:hypothetical protein